MLLLRRRTTLAIVSLLSLAFAACGPNVAVDPGGSSSGGGNTGAGGSPGAGGAGGCPAAEPTPGSPCSSVGQSCSYGNSCCPSIYQCESSGWTLLPTGCAGPPVMCPADPPTASAACDVCFEPGPCVYACPGTTAQISATCNAGIWVLVGECPVPPPVVCGNTTCKDGEICVQLSSGIPTPPECEANPCAPGPLSCDCAGFVCGGLQCSASGQTLFCTCPNCP